MKTPVTIPASERLCYRLMDCEHKPDDADLLFELDQDPEVMRYLNDGKASTRDDVDHFFVPRIAKFTDPLSGSGLWEVTDLNSGDYLGWILVRQYGFDTDYLETDNIELGWRLKRHCWGQGIATEAAATIMQVLQQNPAIRAFSAVADSDNLASTGVMRKLGMRYIDQRIHHTPKRDFQVEYFEMASPCYNHKRVNEPA